MKYHSLNVEFLDEEVVRRLSNKVGGNGHEGVGNGTLEISASLGGVLHLEESSEMKISIKAYTMQGMTYEFLVLMVGPKGLPACLRSSEGRCLISN